VLEELASAGIVIDRISGVSMGALVGGLAAAGMDVDEIDATLYEEWVRGRPLSDYTTPKYALIRGYRFEEMLTRVFGPVAIEELACSFTCASADLRRSELVIHRHGSLGDQVGTSMALPILAPPQVRGRRLLIDGSLIDNLPVGPLADTGEGPVIAVDVKAGVERDRHAGRPSRPPGRGSRRFAGGGPAPPRLGETAMRVLLLATSNTTEAARRDADLLIAPRDPGVGLLEFHQLDRARESGRAAARAALDAAAPDVIERLSGARAP
jgi:NTE family protein